MHRSMLYTALGAVLSFSALPTDAATLLSESFTPPVGACTTATPMFPAGWTRRNVDNLTPAASVNYVNDAWITREDFGGDNTNCVAFSTSFYSPAGFANDFMCTPAVTLTAQTALTWRARAYDPAYRDGYEVRVMRAAPTGGTGVIGNLLTASTVVFSVGAEATAWTNHSVDLTAAGFANEPVYTCFRNNTTDKFLLVVDDVTILSAVADVAVASAPPPSPYTRVPSSLGITMTPTANLRNAGTQLLHNVAMSAEPLRDGVLDGALATSPSVPTLAVGAVQAFTASPARVLDTAGTWTYRYTATTSDLDEEPANDTLTSSAVTVGVDELGRDDGIAVATLGIGAGNGGELGQDFNIPTTAVLSAVRFTLGPNSTPPDGPQWLGSPLDVNIRAFDTGTGKPGAVIAVTAQAIVDSENERTYTLPIASGGFVLAPGRYVVTVLEPAVDGQGDPGGPTLPLQQTTTIFETGHMWVNWPTSPFGDWANVETFGPGFAKPFRVSMIFADGIADDVFADGFEDKPPARAPTANAPAANAPASAVTRRPSDATRPQRLIDAIPMQ